MSADIRDRIIREWFYRLDKGYAEAPFTAEELDKLDEVLTEYGQDRSIFLNEATHIITESPEDVGIIQTELQEIGLQADIIEQVIRIYEKLSESEKSEFNKNFRQHSIESYVDSGWKAFKEFFLVNIGGARGGMGNGEIAIILGVKDAKSGGTAQHDIVMTNGEWEVKELSEKTPEFDPAKEGSAGKFQLTNEIKNFYTDIVLPISDIGDPYEQLKDMVDPASAESLKKLLMIFETRFIESIDKDKLTGANQWKKTAFHNWYEGFKELNAIFYKTELDVDVKDTRLSITQSGDKQAYWISDDDVEKIEKSAGKAEPANINVGEPIDSINNNIRIWFKRLERNEFVRNPRYFISLLNEIKDNFFNNVLGMIWFNNRNPEPHIGMSNDFVIHRMAQSKYMFLRKNASSAQGYPFIQDQE